VVDQFSDRKEGEKVYISDDEKEYLLALLEWRIADHEGQKDWKKYHICKSLMEKLENN
jgi:uncharacterized protein YifE (UPF0438 family)